MKNYDEFRKTVFDKAKKYEAQRKARNKKIIESVSLCSLVIVIALSAYLGILTIPEQLPDNTSATTVTTFDTTTTQTVETSAKETISETTSVITTAESTVASTCPTETQTENTMPETTTAATSDTEESSEFIGILQLEFRGTAKNPDFDIFETKLLEIRTFDEWQTFCENNVDDYPNLEDSDNILDAAYFEEHTLVVIQYAGYDLIAFEHHFTMACAEDDTYVLQITLRKNQRNKQEQIHVMSVEKDDFLYAEICVLEK